RPRIGSTAAPDDHARLNRCVAFAASPHRRARSFLHHVKQPGEGNSTTATGDVAIGEKVIAAARPGGNRRGASPSEKPVEGHGAAASAPGTIVIALGDQAPVDGGGRDRAAKRRSGGIEGPSRNLIDCHLIEIVP